MDWKRIEREVSTLDTLSPEAALERLEALKQTEPDIAELVAGYAGRERNVDSFLRTMAPRAANVVDTLKPGAKLGVWELEDMLGRGGMGAVYKARRADGLYEQSAAVKVVQIFSDAQRARFDQERQRLARLEHPGVVRIIDGGITEDDLAFLVMEYVDGAPLDGWLADQNAGREQVLRLAVEAAQALSHVHGRLILHRDIKPANILVSTDGQVKLIDFGIGSEFRDADDAPFAMTLAFAAPEQLNQKSVDVGADIFAFGATLHKLLTGAMPVRRSDGGVDIDKTLLRDKELAAIIARATAFDPAERYSAVDGLIEDLQHFLNKEPVNAYSTARVYRIGKFFSRYPASSALAVGLLVALIGGLWASLYSADQVHKALIRAENALERERLATMSEAAFSETIQGLFESGLGAEAINSVMLERAREAHEYSVTAPDNAAQIIFSIGRSFVVRGDYKDALTVLEPWLEAGYGPEHLIWQGKVDMAFSYQALREWDVALPIFYEARDYFAEVTDVPTYETVLIANQIAKNTVAAADQAETIRQAELALASNPTANERLYYYSALLSTLRRTGDQESAYKIALEALSFLEAHPLLDRHRGLDVRFFVADLAIYSMNDPEHGIEVMKPVLARNDLSDFAAGLAHQLMGTALAETGDHEGALLQLDAAVQFAQQAAGKSSGFYAAMIADLIEADLKFGFIDRAGDRIRAYFEDNAEEEADITWRFRLAEAHYLFRRGDAEAALSLLARHNITPETAVQAYRKIRLDRLRDLGLDVDSLPERVAALKTQVNP